MHPDVLAFNTILILDLSYFLPTDLLMMFHVGLSVWYDYCWTAWSCSLETAGNMDEVGTALVTSSYYWRWR